MNERKEKRLRKPALTVSEVVCSSYLKRKKAIQFLYNQSKYYDENVKYSEATCLNTKEIPQDS